MNKKVSDLVRNKIIRTVKSKLKKESCARFLEISQQYTEAYPECEPEMVPKVKKFDQAHRVMIP
jgi:hypothetical protein